jgi:hypothetical protein
MIFFSKFFLSSALSHDFGTILLHEESFKLIGTVFTEKKIWIFDKFLKWLCNLMCRISNCVYFWCAMHLLSDIWNISCLIFISACLERSVICTSYIARHARLQDCNKV